MYMYMYVRKREPQGCFHVPMPNGPYVPKAGGFWLQKHLGARNEY